MSVFVLGHKRLKNEKQKQLNVLDWNLGTFGTKLWGTLETFLYLVLFKWRLKITIFVEYFEFTCKQSSLKSANFIILEIVC